MLIIRQAVTDDHAMITRLARMPDFSHQPADPDEITRRLQLSHDSFTGRAQSDEERRFIFVLEDTDAGAAIGMSALHARCCGPGSPLASLQVRKREHYSEDLQLGHVHMTLQVVVDERPASELCGLVLAPPYRGHRDRLGSLLGLVLLHFVGLHPVWFADRLLATLPPPRTPGGRDSLWEDLGRRFINLRYDEAERFARRSREFIPSLFPAGEIYVSLLPPETRNVIGKVGPNAEPARRMLLDLGFAESGRVDPFHGGPILEAATGAIPTVAATRSATLGDPANEHPRLGLVSVGGSGRFRAVRSHYAETGAGISIPGDTAGLLNAHVGDTVAVTELGGEGAESHAG